MRDVGEGNAMRGEKRLGISRCLNAFLGELRGKGQKEMVPYNRKCLLSYSNNNIKKSE